jgi:hypothetical protein
LAILASRLANQRLKSNKCLHGKIDSKKIFDCLHFFYSSACLNGSAIRDNSCGGATIVDAARYDATAILTNTASSSPHMGDCSADKSSASGSDSRFWNAT